MSSQAEKMKEKGNEEFKKGDMAKAIEYYTYATEMDPGNHTYYTNRAAAYAHMKNWEKSLRDAKKSVELNSKWEKGWWRIGNALMALNKPEEAEGAYKNAMELDSKSDTYKELYTKARKEARKGMSEAETLKKEANEMFARGDQEGAIKKYTEALEVCGDEGKEKQLKVDILSNRAACYRQLYNPIAVVDDCTAALKIDPMHTKSLIRRAQAFENLEKYADALKDYDQANLLAPGNKLTLEGASRLRASLRNQKGK